MRYTVHTGTLKRAAEVLGGQALSEYLAVSRERLKRWMDGTVPLPQVIFLKLVDMLLERKARGA